MKEIDHRAWKLLSKKNLTWAILNLENTLILETFALHSRALFRMKQLENNGLGGKYAMGLVEFKVSPRWLAEAKKTTEIDSENLIKEQKP